LCVGGIISLPWFSKELKMTYQRTIGFVASSLYYSFVKFYVESLDRFSYHVLKFQVNRSSGRHHYANQQRLYEFCYLHSFDLWTSYLARILFLKGFGILFWESPNSTKIFNGLQYSFQVWRGFINISESFYYKDSLCILATIRKEDFRINSTFSSDFLVYLGIGVFACGLRDHEVRMMRT
jgi:hypothetical protein